MTQLSFILLLKMFKKVNCPFQLTYIFWHVICLLLISFVISLCCELCFNWVATQTGYFKSLKTQMCVKLLFQTL